MDIVTNRPLCNGQLCAERIGILKALKTRVPQYRIISDTNITCHEPIAKNHARYDAQILPSGETVCFVEYRVRSPLAGYYTTGGFYAYIE